MQLLMVWCLLVLVSVFFLGILPTVEPLSNDPSSSSRSSQRRRRRLPLKLWTQPSAVVDAKHPMMPSLVDMLDDGDDDDTSTLVRDDTDEPHNRKRLPLVFEVDKEGQLLQALAASASDDNNSKRLFVVMYTSQFSQICQRAKLKYQRLALEFGDCVAWTTSDDESTSTRRLEQVGSVGFAHLEWSKQSPLCDHITYLPHVDIYDLSTSPSSSTSKTSSRPNNYRRPVLVASFATMGPAYNFGIKVRKKVKSLLADSSSDDDDDDIQKQDDLRIKGMERLEWWTELDRQEKFGI